MLEIDCINYRQRDRINKYNWIIYLSAIYNNYASRILTNNN